ncbi:MAG: gephyrin-like molybdotransferase Glp [Pirellulales bacterium]
MTERQDALDDTPAADVRMRGFARRWTVDAVLAWVDAHTAALDGEMISLDRAAGRVLTEDIVSQSDVPPFDRAMMDGYAVRAADTQGASPLQPMPLIVVGVALPGDAPPGPVGAGSAVRIMTGAPMPAGADSVLPAELAQSPQSSKAIPHDPLAVSAVGEVSPGKHVGSRGEDVAAGTTVLRGGRRLRPQDIGVLASIDCEAVRVVRRPRVRIVATGNEIYSQPSQRRPYAIADANGPMLAALVERDGGTVERLAITPDDVAALTAAIGCDADVVIVSGGSSVGEEDHAPHVVAALGQLAIHGVAMRPSSPTGMGTLPREDGRPRLVFLLPGNPVSCLCAYDFFAGRAIRSLAGRDRCWPYRATTVRLARKISSQVGRVDYARVRYVDPPASGSKQVPIGAEPSGVEPSDIGPSDVEPNSVEPISVSGASILTSTTRADGFVVVPADSEGYPAAAVVTMFAYE